MCSLYINLWKGEEAGSSTKFIKCTAEVSSTSELISEIAESVIWQSILIRQSVLLELEKQKVKLAMDDQKQKTNSNKVKSPVKRKSEFTNCSSRENDKKKKKFMCNNFGEDEKEQLKKYDKKKNKEKRNVQCPQWRKKENVKKRG